MTISAANRTLVTKAADFGTATPVSARAISAKRFVVASAIVYLLGVTGLIAFSAYVNCWGGYGRVGYFDIRQYNDRLVKVEYLDGLAPARRPALLVFGSSNLMGFRAKDLETLTGRKAFNCYVTGAHAEDHLCLLQHFVHDIEYTPEVIIVGLETWTFRPPEDDHAVIPGVRRCLAGVPQLIRHHPDVSTLRLYWSKLVDCFSRDQLATSWRMLMDDRVERRAWAPLASSPVLQPDGAFRYDPGKPYRFAGKVHALDEHGEFDVTRSIRRVIDGGEPRNLKHFSYFDFDGLWDRRVEWFERFLDLCEKQQIKVAFVVNPIHPLMARLLNRYTPHPTNQAEMLRYVRRWERHYSVILGTFDATELSSFDGDPNGFYDGTHCSPRNSRRLLSRVVGMIPRP